MQNRDVKWYLEAPRGLRQQRRLQRRNRALAQRLVWANQAREAIWATFQKHWLMRSWKPDVANQVIAPR